jgi:predicted translin family RNA/ssDNA-binding protein
MEKLIRYFMEETNKKFDEVKKDIKDVKTSVQSLNEFKVSLMVSSRWVSLIVSTLVGIFTFFASLAGTYYVAKAKAETRPAQEIRK